MSSYRTILLAAVAVTGMTTLLSACGSRDDIPKALKPLTNATLTTGAEFGDLRLGETSLRAFVTRFGVGQPSATIGDDIGFEYSYGGGQFSALFMAGEACLEQARMRAREAADLLREPENFFQAFPACAETPLHSIAVATARDSSEGLFKGQTDSGIALDAQAALIMEKYGSREQVSGLHLAGSRPSDAALEELAYSDGIVFYVGNSPDGPNQGRLVVRKIAIFLPLRPGERTLIQ